MSFTRKIIDGARSGLNTVMEKVAADDTPISHVDEGELQREVERRLAARASRAVAPRDNPLAEMAGASAEARARRGKQAEARAARVHAARDKRERAARAAQEEAFRRAKEQARRAGAGHPRAAAGGRASSTGPAGARGGSPFSRGDDNLAEYYKVLDLPVGAPFEDVKKSYRQLMRKYHPDRHVSDPKKQKAATELSMRVTEAYNAIEKHLKK